MIPTRVLLFAASMYFLGSTAQMDTPVIRKRAIKKPIEEEKIRHQASRKSAKNSTQGILTGYTDRENDFKREDMKQKFLDKECDVSFTRTEGIYWTEDITVVLLDVDKDTHTSSVSVILSLTIENEGKGQLRLLYDTMQRESANSYKDEEPFTELCLTKLPYETEWLQDECLKTYVHDSNPVMTDYDVEVPFYLPGWLNDGFLQVTVHIDCTKKEE